MNSGDKNSGERKGTRPPAKEVIRTPAELIKENYGIKEIMYLLNPVQHRKYAKSRETKASSNGKQHTLEAEIRDEFREVKDPQILLMLGEINIADQLTVGYPVTRKSGKKIKGRIKDRISEGEMFYYLHLSPFARSSVSEMY